MVNIYFYDDYCCLVLGWVELYVCLSMGGWQKLVFLYVNVGVMSLFMIVIDFVCWMVNFEIGVVGGKIVIFIFYQCGVLNDGLQIDYVLGLVYGKMCGFEILFYGGVDVGFCLILFYFLEYVFGIVVFVNIFFVDLSVWV